MNNHLIDVNGCQAIGTIIKFQSAKSKLILKIDNTLTLKPNKMELIFILIDGQLVPFFISANSIIDRTPDSILFNLDEINDEYAAKELINTRVYIPKSNKIIKPSYSDDFDELIGFQVFDLKHGAIGILTELISNQVNPLFLILFEGKEILVPIQEKFIVSIDIKNKILNLKTPEGLIDLYL